MIEVRGLRKRYGTLQALDGVDLDVAAGTFCAVLGPSGAGKSTLMRCLNRLIEPDSGSVIIAGHAAPEHGLALRLLRRDVGMVFQDHNLVPRMSVLKNVLLGRLAHMGQVSSLLQLFPEADIELALDCLARVDLRERAWSRADRLSGGQQQRVGIARALAQRPKVVLADEPVASLDPKTARIVLGDLRRATRDLGVAVLCNLHQVDYALEFADRVIGLHAGRVVCDATPAMLDQSDIDRVYAGSSALSDSSVEPMLASGASAHA